LAPKSNQVHTPMPPLLAAIVATGLVLVALSSQNANHTDPTRDENGSDNETHYAASSDHDDEVQYLYRSEEEDLRDGLDSLSRYSSRSADTGSYDVRTSSPEEQEYRDHLDGLTRYGSGPHANVSDDDDHIASSDEEGFRDLDRLDGSEVRYRTNSRHGSSSYDDEDQSVYSSHRDEARYRSDDSIRYRNRSGDNGENYMPSSDEEVLGGLVRSDTDGEAGRAKLRRAIADLSRSLLSKSSPLINRDCAVCQEIFKAEEKPKRRFKFFRPKKTGKAVSASVVVFLPCLHGFHEECIIQWLKQSPNCPVCRCKLNLARY